MSILSPLSLGLTPEQLAQAERVRQQRVEREVAQEVAFQSRLPEWDHIRTTDQRDYRPGAPALPPEWFENDTEKFQQETHRQRCRQIQREVAEKKRQEKLAEFLKPEEPVKTDEERRQEEANRILALQTPPPENPAPRADYVKAFIRWRKAEHRALLAAERRAARKARIAPYLVEVKR